METQKEHWEKIYATKEPHEVSWTQKTPETSLELIHGLNLPLNASIIDIGGGDSPLIEHLLKEGFTNLSVLDISEKALERNRKRLGENASKVKWIVSDILAFKPDTTYDLWHDRATFHFLTQKEQIEKYKSIIREAVNGYLIIGTFSDKGPKKCSGLDIKQYTEEEMENLLKSDFDKKKCLTVDHLTPFNTTQNFLFCSHKCKTKF
jgi:hypothetical protein